MMIWGKMLEHSIQKPTHSKLYEIYLSEKQT
jgi:hypothetical protein